MKPAKNHLIIKQEYFMEFIKNDAPLSGEIKGIDINDELTKKEFKSIINFIDENLVVLIKNQSIDDYKLKDFSRLFGELDPPAPNPYGIQILYLNILKST